MSGQDIKTFVVIDLETNGLPSEQFNTCAITEISLYAFSANYLTERDGNRKLLKSVTDGLEGFDPLPPELPRVLNKMTLMINPRRMIHPIAERVTGLSNEILEKESPFDANTATSINLFLGRLEQPVCLVAHNGWHFDYPIIRHIYEKLEMSLPSSIYCVDSLQAFRELDEKSEKIEVNKQFLTTLEADENAAKKLEIELNVEPVEIANPTSSKIDDPLEQNSKIDWKLNNETTPHRHGNTIRKDAQNENVMQKNIHVKERSVSLFVRRSLFAGDFKPKRKYPPKGVYKLGNIYKRCFNQEPINLHRAESDVEILTKLILHYGLDFLAYCEERKQPFAKVPKLGSSIN